MVWNRSDVDVTSGPVVHVSRLTLGYAGDSGRAVERVALPGDVGGFRIAAPGDNTNGDRDGGVT